MSWLLKLVGFAGANWMRVALYGVVVAAVLAAVAGWGYMKGVERLYSYQAEQAKQAVKIIVKQGEVTERVMVKYVKVQARTRVVTETVEKEVVRYVEKNTGNCLDPEWGRLHDAAASNTVPEPAGGADATPGASEAIKTVTENYGACNRTANRLTALQEWVTEQQKVHP